MSPSTQEVAPGPGHGSTHAIPDDELPATDDDRLSDDERWLDVVLADELDPAADADEAPPDEDEDEDDDDDDDDDELVEPFDGSHARTQVNNARKVISARMASPS